MDARYGTTMPEVSKPTPKDALAKFISPSHLDLERITKQAETLHQSEYKCIILDDFLQTDLLRSLQQFMQSEASYQRMHKLYSDDKRVDQQTFLNAPEEQRFYRHSEGIGVKDQFRISTNYIRFLRLHEAIANELVDYFRHYSDTDIKQGENSVNAKSYSYDDFLRKHSDASLGRVLCVNFYLSSDWDPAYGGRFQMQDRTSKEYLTIDPTENRCVIFDPRLNNPHWIESFNEQAKHWTRYSLSFWYSET